MPRATDPAYAEFVRYLADDPPRFGWSLSNLSPLTPAQIAMVMRDDLSDFEDIKIDPAVGADNIEFSESNVHVAAVAFMSHYKRLVVETARRKVLRDIDIELMGREFELPVAEGAHS